MQSDQTCPWVGTCCVDLAITSRHLPWTRIPTGKRSEGVDEVTLHRSELLAAPMQTMPPRGHRLEVVEHPLMQAP